MRVEATSVAKEVVHLCARSKTVMLLSEPAAITVGERISFKAAMQVMD